MGRRILVISTNREFAPQPVVPLGAAWVAEALHRAGFTVHFLDLCFALNPRKALQATLRTFCPDGIVLSVRNLDNCDFLAPRSFLPELKKTTDYLKSVSHVPILIGGSGVSIMAPQVLDYLQMPFAVAGEGELAAVLFFAASGPAALESVPGLVRRGTAPVSGNVPCRGANPDQVVPQLHRWVDMARYLAFEPVLPVQGKRGCAKHCLYCTYNRIEGASWRPRDPSAVVGEMAALARKGARQFEFIDSIFNEPEGYLETLLEEILRQRLKVSLHISSLSPKNLTWQQVRLMERSGVVSAVITPEAACDTTLAALGKDFTAAEVYHASRLLAGSGITALWCFLLGGPMESCSTLRETVRFINTGISRKDRAFLTIGIRIYPHTGLHELARSEGVVGEADSLLMPVFYFSRRLTLEQARHTLRDGLVAPHRCIFLSDTQLSWLASLRRAGTLFRLPSPFWRYASYLNRLRGGSSVLNRPWAERTGKDMV